MTDIEKLEKRVKCLETVLAFLIRNLSDQDLDLGDMWVSEGNGFRYFAVSNAFPGVAISEFERRFRSEKE